MVEEKSATSGTLPTCGDVVELHAADGLVGRVVEIRGVRRELERALRGHGGVVRRRFVGGDVDHLAETLGFADGLLRPGAGVDVVHGGIGRGQVHRDGREHAGGAALQEQHLVVSGDGQQLAQVGFGLLGDGDERLAAMGDFHHRHAAGLSSRSSRPEPVAELRGAAWPAPRRN